MPRQGYPRRPGSEVIPSTWALQHRPVAAGTMTGATCQIRHPGGDPVHNADGSTSGSGATAHYDGGCRIQVLSVEDRTSLFGEQDTTTQGYLVTTTMANADTLVDDLVKVTACDADPTMVGRSLRVKNLSRGSQVWERDLVCIDNLG